MGGLFSHPMLTYSYPEDPLVAPVIVPVRKAAALEAPSDATHQSKPDVPSPRQVDLGSGFRLTTHIVPAAFPRSLPPTTCPPHPSEVGKDDRDPEVAEEVIGDLRRTRAAYQGPEPIKADELDRSPQWHCVNRYWRDQDSRQQRKQRLTMFFVHACGFPKETWEPTIRYIIEFFEATNSGVEIEEFWCFEATQHGDSAILNASARPGAVNWHDDARDIIQFLSCYLPETSSPAKLPTHLARLPEAVSKDRRTSGFKHRSVVTVAHSYGGCLAALSAIHQPSLFPSLILIDPIIAMMGHQAGIMLAFLALKRRDHWTSREAARAQLARLSYFATWDPAALDLFVDCGLCEDKVRGGVTLKTTRMQEVVIYVEPEAWAETWQGLEDLDERVQLHWIMPGQFDGYAMDEQFTKTLVWRRKTRSTNVRIPSAAHLMPQEVPRDLAQELHRYMTHEFGVKAARL